MSTPCSSPGADHSNSFGRNGGTRCSRPYGLMGLLSGRYFYVGQHQEFKHQAGEESRLYLSVNDDMVGNGSGTFKATIMV